MDADEDRVAIQPKTGKASKTKAVKDPHAPKKLKSQAKQDASPGSKAEARDSEASDSESDSDDELLIENEDPPELTPDLLTVSAPTDVHGKALYHAVQAVWSPRNRSAPPEKIRSGIAGFGDTVRGLRDAWKAKNDSLRKAEIPGSPTAADAAKLKDEVAHYRQVVENVMARALLFGHPAIVKRYVYSPPSSDIRDCCIPRVRCVRCDVLFGGPRDFIDTMLSSDPLLLWHFGPCRYLETVTTMPRRTAVMQNGCVYRYVFLDSVQIVSFRDLSDMPMGRTRKLLPMVSLITLTDNVLFRLGENQFTMSALQSFMLDRFNAGDYDSSLVKEILKVSFATLLSLITLHTNTGEVRGQIRNPRFRDAGDDKVGKGPPTVCQKSGERDQDSFTDRSG